VVDFARKGRSRAELLMAAIESHALYDELTAAEIAALPYLWEFWARPKQMAPYQCDDLGCGCEGSWVYWLILAGRGFGKTRTCAEWFRKHAPEQGLINLVGPTFDDVRAIMLEGESGLFEICPDDERPVWKKQSRKLIWPSGAESLIFTADEPERLRGKQHRGGWLEELAAWRYPEALEQFQLGLRLPGKDGWRPRAVVATTPKPLKFLRELIDEVDEETGARLTHVTRGTTYDNKTNLDPVFYGKVIRKFEGTRKGRQELLGQILADVVGALWQRDWIDRTRVRQIPSAGLMRKVLAIDPAKSHGEHANNTGLVLAGMGYDREYYVLDDLTLNASALTWAMRAITAAVVHKCDYIVYEANTGGETVEQTLLRAADHYRKNNPGVIVPPLKAVHATRGKRTRAEPIATLYESGRVHHVGSLPDLEDELCEWVPTKPGDSPDRLDADCWALHELVESGTITHDGQGMAGPSPWREPEESEL
jgi:phage terminase large subunit-like protein